MKPVVAKMTLAICMLILVSGCMTAPDEQLRLAAADGNLLRVQTFLRQGVSPQAADARGVTPVFLAAKNGHRDVVALLLEQGATMSPSRQDGVTPRASAA
jgi:ankyrin